MAFPYPYVGPIAPYNNVPIVPENYQPRRFVISAVTLGQTTTITTTEDMDYVIGQLVRLIIPPSYGCRQLNEQTGYVIETPASNQVTLDIDSAGGDSFIASSATTKAQILAIGDINSGFINETASNVTTYIPGSFINTSS